MDHCSDRPAFQIRQVLRLADFAPDLASDLEPILDRNFGLGDCYKSRLAMGLATRKREHVGDIALVFVTPKLVRLSKWPLS
jgi:hypothetical protein